MEKRCLVLALGGNALSQNSMDSIHDEFQNTRKSLKYLLPVFEEDVDIVITHGNGPQVGKKLRRVELSLRQLPETPLGVLVADTQGSIGYMIEQSLINWMYDHQINRQVSTLLTQVLVDSSDPALMEPSKFIGQFYNIDEAMHFRQENGWTLREDSGRGWRRVVGSPRPLEIINIKTIRSLVRSGIVVIAGGGGGIPCFYNKDGHLDGVDAVIDKDRCSALLGNQVEADELFMITGVNRVAINFGKANEERLEKISCSQALELLAEGHFPAGSMGPKIESAVEFIQNGGKKCVITDFNGLESALNGSGGTFILPD
jgi:carbamate kinase